jgi:DNA-binding MarR family transcriptional regulator
MPAKITCYCAGLRQAARAITQKYDDALRDTHLTVTQFTLLGALSEMDRPRVNDLAEALSMDQTTLSRTLRVMQRDGLLEAVTGADRRESRWLLTSSGRQRYKQAIPLWKIAQRDVESLLGKTKAKKLGAAAFELATRLSA